MKIQANWEQTDASLNVVLRVIDDAWEEMRRTPSVQRELGARATRLPDVSFNEAQRRSGVGRALLKRLEDVDVSALPHDLGLTARLVRLHASAWSREVEWYWSVVDPLRTGVFGMFLPTAYCGGLLLNDVHGDFASFPFIESGDADRYLALVQDYARLIDQFTDRTAGQAERGIRMPKVQVRQARALLAALKSGARDVLSVAPQRLVDIPADEFLQELESRIATRVEPAFDRAVAGLSDSYLGRAPDKTGLGQYTNGVELYAELVKLNTTLDVTPEEIHALGLARMTEIQTSMHAIHKELGFGGDRAAFLAKMDRDSRWRASTVEAVASMFQRYMDRINPRVTAYFSVLPKAPCGVASLPVALQRSMTYGYYDAPRRGRAEGLYLFNAENLRNRALFTLAALCYHELVPGHHLQMAGQQENEDLHPIRKYSFINAYNEGWAEYAATLAGDMGLYEEPEERYGRLVMDAFLTSRLVVDTGMNMLGWSLERAREYMRQNSGLTESEIVTESVRYSCDIPGQALAYKVGDTQILALRERMRYALGPRFDLRDFHAAVLGPGAIPLRDLEWHIEHEIERIMRRPEFQR